MSATIYFVLDLITVNVYNDNIPPSGKQKRPHIRNADQSRRIYSQEARRPKSIITTASGYCKPGKPGRRKNMDRWKYAEVRGTLLSLIFKVDVLDEESNSFSVVSEKLQDALETLEDLQCDYRQSANGKAQQ